MDREASIRFQSLHPLHVELGSLEMLPCVDARSILWQGFEHIGGLRGWGFRFDRGYLNVALKSFRFGNRSIKNK